MASTLKPSMSPLFCAISGQACADPVLTPSGYICERRLLLSKLVDTNGLDPFVDNGRELKESDLISIQRPLVTGPPPRLPSVTSFSNLLEMMQQEHDALLLELYDTRKALEETRMELSQALYQNDAAVRVIARLSLERDEARRLLSQWSAEPPTTRPIPSDDDSRNHQPSSLPAVVAEEDHPMEVVNETQPSVTAPPVIPQEDLQNLIASWKELSDQRRQNQKKRKHELSTEQPIQFHENSKAEVKSVHKSNKPGIVALSTIRHPTTQNEYVLSAGIDKTLVLYNQTTQNIVQTLMNSNGKHFTALDVVSTSSSLLIGVADTAGMLQVFKEQVSNPEDNSPSTYELLDAGLQLVTEQDAGGEAEIVAVSFHPLGRYLFVSLTTGKVVIVKVMENHLQILTSFPTEQGDSGTTTSITCSALHPDGLIYSVGKSDGSIEIWDLKTLSLASTLEIPNGIEKVPVTSLAFSENGYHFASSLESGEVMVWDLRKVSLITTLNTKSTEEDHGTPWVTTSPIRSVAFDPKGKYLAYCSDAGEVRITTVKEWGKTAMFAADLTVAKKKKDDTQLKTWIAWSPHATSYIVAGCNKSRFIKLVYDTIASEAK